jgi:hypothetical protein
MNSRHGTDLLGGRVKVGRGENSMDERTEPVEAGVDPLFEIVAENKERGLADEASERWFQAALSDPPKGVRRILRRCSRAKRLNGDMTFTR